MERIPEQPASLEEEANRESCDKHWILDDHTDLKANVETFPRKFLLAVIQ